MSFPHSSQGPFAAAGDVQNRRSILQGLQQTKNRLQRLHSDEPTAARLSPGGNMTGPRSVGRSPVLKATPSPGPSDQSMLHQHKAALQQATSQSFGYFIAQPGSTRNLILPVLPRFNPSNGELINN